MLDTEKIKARRERLGLSMADAAEKAGLAGRRQQWFLIESGQRSNVTIDTLDKIADALGCNPCDLLLKRPRAKAGK